MTKLTKAVTPLVLGNQIWVICEDCEKWVRVNKPLFGALHLCLTPFERAQKKAARKG